LKEIGIAGVFPVGSEIEQIVNFIKEKISAKK